MKEESEEEEEKPRKKKSKKDEEDEDEKPKKKSKRQVHSGEKQLQHLEKLFSNFKVSQQPKQTIKKDWYRLKLPFKRYQPFFFRTLHVTKIESRFFFLGTVLDIKSFWKSYNCENR